MQEWNGKIFGLISVEMVHAWIWGIWFACSTMSCLLGGGVRSVKFSF
jgi:hypothetical protein